MSEQEKLLILKTCLAITNRSIYIHGFFNCVFFSVSYIYLTFVEINKYIYFSVLCLFVVLLSLLLSITIFLYNVQTFTNLLMNTLLYFLLLFEFFLIIHYLILPNRTNLFLIYFPIHFLMYLFIYPIIYYHNIIPNNVTCHSKPHNLQNTVLLINPS